MIESILSDWNVELARDHLLKKRDSCGVDGMRLSELNDYIRNNLNGIRSSIIDGTFRPGLVQEVEIIDPRGKIRTISKLTSVDRLILRAIQQVLYDQFSPLFSPFSYAYQTNKGVAVAARQAADYVESGYSYTVDIDVENYFDNIPHYKLGEILLKYGLDKTTNGLVQKFLTCGIVRDFEISRKEKGLVQGSPLSPLLSNLYLHEADMYFTKSGFKFCRYGDDMKLFAKSFEEGLEVFGRAKEFLKNELHLDLNSQKSGVFPALDRIYLGYRFFSFPNGKIEMRKESRNTKTNMFSWYSSSIQKLGNEYHLIADGILTRKDFNLLFENPEKKMYLPAERTDCLNLYSNITLSSNFFSFAAQNNLLLNFFNKHGEYEGAFVPSNLSASASLTIQQSLVYADGAKRLEMAKQFATAAAHNIRENLKYYARHNSSEGLRQSIDNITLMLSEEKEAQNITELMLIEGRIRAKYYDCFNEILPADDFLFSKRSRRPPEDPLNSLISFGNAVLYRRVAKEIYMSRLDIRIGYLHSTNRRYESLNLDISELFRPVIVDKVIFSLINKHMIGEGLHFDELDSGAVYLNSEGKKIYIAEFEKKLVQRMKIDGGTISYAELIRAEIHKLSRHFDNGEPYKAFKYFL